MDLITKQYDERCRQIISGRSDALENILCIPDPGEMHRKIMQHILTLHEQMQEEMDSILSQCPQLAADLERILFSRLNEYKAGELRRFTEK